jgi:hypothetical protein
MVVRLNQGIAIGLFVLAGCGGSMSVSNPESITGVERFGWDQPAADAGELATFRYAFYVDDARSDAADVTCVPGTGAQFACTAQLPVMSAGAHTLQVAAFVLDAGQLRESSRSAPVRVIKR